MTRYTIRYIEAGDCAAFKASNPEGHHLHNRDAEAALILEVGTVGSAAGLTEYSDIDLRTTSAGYLARMARSIDSNLTGE